MLKALFKVNKAFFAIILTGLIVTPIMTSKVYADCEPTYGGETCIYNKSFEIDKEVRLADSDDDFEDKLTLNNVEVGKEIEVEYRIEIKNIGEIEVDNMKYEDDLPDHFERSGGSGLTEYWNDFEPGETKKFYIKATIDGDYITSDLVDCFINDVELFWDGNEEGSAQATVCIANGEITELPETGPTANIVMTLLGITSLGSGLGLKKLWS